MGNAVERVGEEWNREFRTGKLLLEAVRSNSRRLVKRAIMQARNDFLDFRATFTVETPKSKLRDLLIHYLTQPYDIGDGVIFKETAVNVAKQNKSDEALQAILQSLQAFEKGDLSLSHFENETSSIPSKPLPLSSLIPNEMSNISRALNPLEQSLNAFSSTKPLMKTHHHPTGNQTSLSPSTSQPSSHPMDSLKPPSNLTSSSSSTGIEEEITPQRRAQLAKERLQSFQQSYQPQSQPQTNNRRK